MHSSEELRHLVRRCELINFSTEVRADKGVMLQTIRFTTTTTVHSSLISDLQNAGFEMVFISPLKKARIDCLFEKELTSQKIIENEVKTS